MTAEPVRDIGYAAWYDPDAWMEKMDGPRWDSIIKSENKRVADYAKRPEVLMRLTNFNALAERGHALSQISPNFKSGPVNISPMGSIFIRWNFESSRSYHICRDVFGNSRGAWSIRDVGDGSELYQLEYTPLNKENPIWSLKPVGQHTVVAGQRCYYLGVIKKLWYNELWSCNALTGQDQVLIYKELDPEVVLEIVRGPYNKIYMTQERSQDITWWEVKDDKITQSTGPEGWNKLIIKRTKGASALKRENKTLINIPAGQITIDEWSAHANEPSLNILVEQPHKAPRWYRYTDTNIITPLEDPPKSGLKLAEGKSTNGTRCVLVFKEELQKPSNVLIIGYGAYGMPTRTSYARAMWNPLIEQGWAIAYTFLPGGGDDSEEYAKQARRTGREKTINSFLDCISSIKKNYNLQARNIVIYGRSAGGLLIGGSIQKYPDGSLFGGVFTEVPYLDELRTTTNASLPLTQLEYNEFGDPSHRLEDFLSIGLLSPADAAVGLNTSNIFIYAKTAINDSQVYAYESVKWIKRLRESSPTGLPKILKVNYNTGHFTPPNLLISSSAFDCAILDTMPEKK